MKISEKKVVALTYTLTVDGQVADQTTEDRPLDFIFGMGYLLPKFEENIAGKEPGDSFEFTLTPAEGYGEKIQEGLLTVGNMIPMMNQQGGVLHGKVHEVKDDSVMMNFNHPMAGKTLNFTGKILTVRDATEQELKEGLHGEYKQSSCGSGCSSCGGDCCGGCN